MPNATAHAAPPRAAALMFAAAAIALLLATWWLHLPLMLWDHIDLVPIYDAWRQGGAPWDSLWRVHDGSHFHIAAYLVLLATTHLSGGQPLLDCLVSWALLAVQAGLLLWMARRTLPAVTRSRAWQAAIVLLALYPGHLANLQWGWQVAVFISLLFGAVIPVALLTQGPLSGWRSMLAALSAALGVMGFSTALAMFPVAMLLVVARPDAPWTRRLLCAAPWAALLVVLLLALRAGHAAPPAGWQPLPVLHYTLNYLGGGVLRIAEGLAAAWATVALGVLAVAAIVGRDRSSARPWLALALFALGAALLTALGRAPRFGAEHGFVTRYVSVSSLFWLGWLGSVLAVFHERPAWWRGMRWVVVASLVFALANAAHLVKKAWVVHERAETYAARLRAGDRAVDADLLDQAYGDRARYAADRLETLRRYGFPPFDAPAPERGVSPD